MTAFSIVTNASLADGPRLRQVIPHWIRVFGDRFSELAIVLDPTPPSGRIAELHAGSADAGSVRLALDEAARLDARVRLVELPAPDALRWLSGRWFRSGHPIRCQGGTPIAAFLFAISQAAEPLVLKTDCDMLFCDQGWLGEALAALGAGDVDLVRPPLPGGGEGAISSRAFLLNPSHLQAQRLPIRAHRLDPLRRVHRRLTGRPTWLALETMFEREAEAGRLTSVTAPGRGFALHVTSLGDMEKVRSGGVLSRVERGDLPEGQRGRRDFVAAAW
jgi:hypothetical protein